MPKRSIKQTIKMGGMIVSSFVKLLTLSTYKEVSELVSMVTYHGDRQNVSQKCIQNTQIKSDEMLCILFKVFEDSSRRCVHTAVHYQPITPDLNSSCVKVHLLYESLSSIPTSRARRARPSSHQKISGTELLTCSRLEWVTKWSAKGFRERMTTICAII